MPRLILLRHGQSLWNLENKFTGWTDVDLSVQGREEAASAGKKLASEGLKPSVYFTSYLTRAVHTMQIVADVMHRVWVPDVKDWHLNERHYGALQGLDKTATARKYGDEQIHIWRRSYNVMPPALSADDPRHPKFDERYSDFTADELPVSESLEMAAARVKCCWEEKIIPALRHYGDTLVVAHGNSLRALVMMLRKLTPQQVMKLEIPTGTPWVFNLSDTLAPLDDCQL